MTATEKKKILEAVSEKLDKVVYGKIIVELRGPGKPVDIVMEDRERFTTCKKPK